MKKILSILLVSIILFGCGGKNERYHSKDVHSDSPYDILYEKWSNYPFPKKKISGIVFNDYPNGQLMYETNYKKGKMDGLSEVFYKDGKRKSEVYFKNGEIISEKYWDKKGGEITFSEYTIICTKDKEVQISPVYVDKRYDISECRVETIDENDVNGRIVNGSIFFVRSTMERMNGILCSKYSDGKLQGEIPIIDGYPKGFSKSYHHNGEVKNYRTFTNFPNYIDYKCFNENGGEIECID